MLSPLPAVSAFRIDLERHPGRLSVSPFDPFWILIAAAVERLCEFGSSETRSAFMRSFGEQLTTVLADSNKQGRATPNCALRLARCFREATDTRNREATIDALLSAAEEMESAGTLQLAFSMLAHLRQAWPTLDMVRFGKTLAIQARIAREFGDLAQAAQIYLQLANFAREKKLADMSWQAGHGLGGLALAKGNLPEARLQYESALRYAVQLHSTDFAGRTHRGLLIVAAKEGNHDAALQHGWAAFTNATGDQNDQAELLGNIGGLLRETGHYMASLQCYSLAVQRSDSERVRLPALGGAALAAALVGNTALLQSLSRRITREVAHGAQPYNAAQVFLDLAVASEAVGNVVTAHTFAAKAEGLSSAQGYFELEYLAKQLQERTALASHERVRAPIVLTESTTRVIDSVALLADENSSVIALAATTE